MSSVIYQKLADQTNELIRRKSSMRRLGDNPIQVFKPFAIGALGNFPYYWQNPRNLTFNSKTYTWINANLKSDNSPIVQASGSNFTNQFISALGSISYHLSNEDQAKLNEAGRQNKAQSEALLYQWKLAYKKIPPATSTQQPIDVILEIIRTVWCSTSITILDMANSDNLSVLLSNMPPSGIHVLPALALYLKAMSGVVSLINASSMNNGYLQEALAAVQSPKVLNGGLTLDNGSIVPAYSIATPLSDILQGLRDESAKASIHMELDSLDGDQVNVTIPGKTPFKAPIASIFAVSPDKDEEYLKTILETSSKPVKVEVSFSGLTPVYFGPESFNGSTRQYWFYMKPILDAIKNGQRDITGYKFSPDPQMDFSTSGTFGILQGVVISNSPMFNIRITSDNFKNIEAVLSQALSIGIKFLDVSPEEQSQISYSHKVTTNTSNKTVLISSTPQVSMNGLKETSLNSTAWVHGVLTNFPAA